MKRLLKAGWRFELHQALRLIQRANPKRRLLGYFGSPVNEAVRLHGVHELTSPIGTVHEIRADHPRSIKAPSDIPVHVLTPTGLTDGYSACSLPTIYIEQVRRCLNKGNADPAAFIDLFNHRLLSLEYRAWEKNRPHLRFERSPDAVLDRQTLSRWLYSLMGAGSADLLERLQVPDRLFLPFTAALSSPSRPATTLSSILADALDVTVSVDSFVGRWCEVSPNDRAALPSNSPVGDGAILGSRYWYPQATFRVKVGPLTFAEFETLLPGGRRFSDLVEITNHYTRLAFSDFEIELSLKDNEVPQCVFPKAGRSALRLGWFTWLKGAEGIQRVVFRSNDPAAVVRHRVVDNLMRFKRRLKEHYSVRLTWTEAVIAHCVQFCGGANATREQVTTWVNESVATPADSLCADNPNALIVAIHCVATQLQLEAVR